MHTEPMMPARSPEPAATPPVAQPSGERAVTWVVGRTVVRVERLDAHGEAVGVVERWLTQPSEAEWALVYGPRAAETALPAECVFIGGLPGEVVELELRWPTPRPGRPRARRVPEPRARVVAVGEPASARVPAGCLVFGECGGCQLQHMAYDQQLAWKTARVAELARQAGLGAVPVASAIGCDVPWNYRNHMRFSVDRDGRPGLTARGSHRVLPLRACPIAQPLLNAALAILADAPLARPQVLLRCGAATGEVLVQPAPAPEIAARLRAAGLDLRAEDLTEEVAVPDGRARFTIRPSSFFQTNTAQANRMAELVLAGLPAGPDVTLVDAYCGVGTFAALMAPGAGRVVAIEESASAVRDARANLDRYPNVAIVQGKVEVVLPTLAERLDGLVIDPPRAGCARPVLDALIARRVPRVVYVSCEPTTLVRDLAYLCHATGAYRVVGMQPLDMFPQTAHIETIATLEAV